MVSVAGEKWSISSQFQLFIIAGIATSIDIVSLVAIANGQIRSVAT